MSVYKRKGSPFYHYEFQRDGIRFSGTTKKTTKAAALAFEKDRKHEAAVELHRIQVEGDTKELTINQAADRYWQEKGQFEGASESVFSRLANLVRIFGPETLLHHITTDQISRYVSKRRGEQTKGGNLPANATVNRDVELYRTLRNRADNVWEANVGKAPLYRDVLLEEPDVRVRELSLDEEDAFFDALRDDYKPVIEFLLLTGLRRGNGILLQKRQVNWTDRIITVRQKSKKPGGKVLIVNMTRRIEELIRSQWMHHETCVWTYEAERNTRTAIKGQRYPITEAGFKSITKRTITKAGLEDFHIHDLRHTFASRFTRMNGNLELTRQVLGHADIATTTRYAHATQDDIRTGMETMEAEYSQLRSQQKSRKS